jgi:hypothetical protein
MGKSKHR